jgi:hypothetical protein
MSSTFRGLGLAGALALVSSLAAVPRLTAQSTSAYVYVQSQGPAGPVYGYSANSSGQLSAITGSPFKPGTQIIGSNKSQFFTLGKTLIHSYAIGSNGAIGAQESQIPFLNYSGGSCGGGTSGLASGLLDHSGQYIYLLLENGGDGSCAAYQTYKINSGGSFSFDGDTEVNFGAQTGPNFLSVGLPSILGNETFAYADESSGHLSNPIGFRRESSGTLQTMQFGEVDPTLANGNYNVSNPDASPTGNYVVFQLYPNDSNPPQLGSYTVDPQGNLSTTNTSSNMPTSELEDPRSVFSPDGRWLVLYAGENAPGKSGNGIEIYNFNNASPLTLNTRFLLGTPISRVAWDNSNHLYAISQVENKMWVYYVQPASVGNTAIVSVSSPQSLVVVSANAGNTCSIPATDGVNVCSPEQDASVTSPLQINARATVSGGVYRFELWWGSKKLATVDNSGIMNQTVSLTPGTYKLTFSAYNSSGTHEYATRSITVK